MLVQGSATREEVRRVLFREENVESGGYASVQTPEARVEDRPGVSMETQRPSTSDQHQLIETFW